MNISNAFNVVRARLIGVGTMSIIFVQVETHKSDSVTVSSGDGAGRGSETACFAGSDLEDFRMIRGCNLCCLKKGKMHSSPPLYTGEHRALGMLSEPSFL